MKKNDILDILWSPIRLLEGKYYVNRPSSASITKFQSLGQFEVYEHIWWPGYYCFFYNREQFLLVKKKNSFSVVEGQKVAS